MNNQPLVSVLIPCYNHEDFLDDCLTGILKQDYDNIELLICDDNSMDNSFEKIKSYEQRLRQRFSYVKILRNEKNQGVTKNINRMLACSNGEFIKIIASDDVMEEHAVGKMVQFLISHSAVDVVVVNGAKISECQHYPDYLPGEKIYSQKPNFSGKDLFERTYRLNNIFAPGVMVRKTVYDKYGYYDEKIAIEDLEFWLRILLDKKTVFAFLDEVLIYYRINQNSMTSLAGNSGLEQRRIKFHLAELQILNKYRSGVNDRLYAETVLFRILSEKGIAVSNRLSELEKLVNEECHNFNLWKNISFKTHVYYYYALFRYKVKKIILSFR